MAGTTVENNSTIRALVIDVSKIERLVDLTLKPEFLDIPKEESSIMKTVKVSILLLRVPSQDGYSLFPLALKHDNHLLVVCIDFTFRLCLGLVGLNISVFMWWQIHMFPLSYFDNYS